MDEEKPWLKTPLIVAEDSNGGWIQKRGLWEKKDVVEEVKKQLGLAGPLIMVNLLVYSLQVISVMFVGHLGELSLSGASMATSFASVTGFSLLVGMGSALETFCGQSYGAKQYHMLGIYMQRAILVLLGAAIPLALVWANAGQILTFIGQDPMISAAAGDYALFMIPSIFAYALLQPLIRFLQTQNKVTPMVVCSGITAVSHCFVCWFLVFQSGLGYRGAALANAVSYWVNAVMLAVYVGFSSSCENTWTGFSVEAFSDVFEFVKLSVPSAVMLSLEIWSFEMMVLLSGFLPNPRLETSVLSISLNTCSMFYMIPLGLSGAVSTRVSNELGAGRAGAAILATCVSLSMVMTEGLAAATVMILGRNLWGYCYSKEEMVVRYIGKMLILIAISHLFDGIQSVLSGTTRGIGRQKVGAIANLGAYYLIGIPTAMALAFTYHFGGKGLWVGLIVALLVQALSLFIITLRTDWDEEVQKARDRASCDIVVRSSLLPNLC